MTDKDLEFIGKLYNKCYALKKKKDAYTETLSEIGADGWAKLNMEYEEIDIFSELFANTTFDESQMEKKVLEIRNFVLLKTNGMVRLDDRTITRLIYKIYS